MTIDFSVPLAHLCSTWAMIQSFFIGVAQVTLFLGLILILISPFLWLAWDDVKKFLKFLWSIRKPDENAKLLVGSLLMFCVFVGGGLGVCVGTKTLWTKYAMSDRMTSFAADYLGVEFKTAKPKNYDQQMWSFADIE